MQQGFLKILIFFLTWTPCFAAQDLASLKNDKEISSNFLKEKNEDEIIRQALINVKLRFGDFDNFKSTFNSSLKKSLQEVTHTRGVCTSFMARRLIFHMGHAVSSKELLDKSIGWLHLARKYNLVDDILAYNLAQSLILGYELDQVTLYPQTPNRTLRVKEKVKKDDDLKKIFKQLEKKWPKGINSCAEDSWSIYVMELVNLFKFSPQDERKLNKVLRNTNLFAYRKNLISKTTWSRLEVMRKYKDQLMNRISLERYLDITYKAKNLNLEDLNYLRPYKHITRYSKESINYLSDSLKQDKILTHRYRLYQKFNSTQILYLAENIMLKTIKRMNATKSEIHIDYGIEDKNDELDEEDKKEVYEISPMEQYRMAIKMLKKELANMPLSVTFGKVPVDYDDVILASIETGLLRFDEIDQIVSFSKFWQKGEKSSWDTFVEFSASFGVGASYYLPFPFNIVGAAGLIYGQTLLKSKEDKANKSEGNDNSIF